MTNERRAVVVVFAALLACERDNAERGALQGVVELHERRLGFEIQGRLAELVVRRGQRVEAGQALALLDDALERPQRDAREQEFRAASAQLDLVREGSRREEVRAVAAQLRGARAAERTAAEQLLRTRSLRARDVVAQAQLDEADAQAARARSEREALEERFILLRAGSRSQDLRAAQARSDAARATLAAADARLARLVLRAPVSGTVLDTTAEPGEILAPGTPVVVLGETRRPYLDVFVAQQDLAGVRVGAVASVRTDSAAEGFRGTVEDVSRTTEFTPRYLFSPKERATLVVRVRIAVEDPEEKLHAGVPAQAIIDRGAPKSEAKR
jgi:HlyD family secretion protein